MIGIWLIQSDQCPLFVELETQKRCKFWCTAQFGNSCDSKGKGFQLCVRPTLVWRDQIPYTHYIYVVLGSASPLMA